jgi:hypothetical protein
MKWSVLLAVVALSACGSPAAVTPTPSPTPHLTPSPSGVSTASPTSIPLGRSNAALAYDQAHHNALLFGGLADQTLLGDTWTWNGAAWTHRQGLTANPQPRKGAAMAYDERNHQVILFGGVTAAGQQNDSWAWDGGAWQLLHPAHAPSPRESAAMTSDPALSAVILYGGIDDSTAQPGALHDTWSWNGSDWSPVTAPGPPGGVRPRVAFLLGANLLERFGDCIESNDRSLYAFDGHLWAPHPETGTWPPALCIPSLAGDPVRHQLVLFGGNPGNGAAPPPADTWSYDGSSWSKLSPSQSPPARYEAPMVYDSDHHVMLLFGGQGLTQGQAGPLNDTWTWDGSNWTAHQ